MPVIVHVALILIIIGVILSLINRYIPMAGSINVYFERGHRIDMRDCMAAQCVRAYEFDSNFSQDS